jgi:hypothetical protein
MSQTPGDHEPTTALRHLHADTPRYGTLTLTLRRKSPRPPGVFQGSLQHCVVFRWLVDHASVRLGCPSRAFCVGGR